MRSLDEMTRTDQIQLIRRLRDTAAAELVYDPEYASELLNQADMIERSLTKEDRRGIRGLISDIFAGRSTRKN